MSFRIRAAAFVFMCRRHYTVHYVHFASSLSLSWFSWQNRCSLILVEETLRYLTQCCTNLGSCNFISLTLFMNWEVLLSVLISHAFGSTGFALLDARKAKAFRAMSPVILGACKKPPKI